MTEQLIYSTKRPTCDALEEILYQEFPVLDHGHVVVCDYMGDEFSVLEAARTSYGGGTRSVSPDIGLLRYLLRNHHATPFEMCEIKFRMKLPIFVARQIVRHRTASLNEVSARYSVLEKEFYIPDAKNIAPQAKDNKQGRAGELTPAQAEHVQDLLKTDAELCYSHYTALLGDEANEVMYNVDFNKLQEDENFPGIARELARMNLNLNYYTSWIWKIDLRNLLGFLYLRCDPHAQYEVRVYANAMADIVKRWLPNIWAAFEDYKVNAVTFSAQEMAILRNMINSFPSVPESHKTYEGLSKREQKEFMDKIRG